VHFAFEPFRGAFDELLEKAAAWRVGALERARIVEDEIGTKPRQSVIVGIWKSAGEP